MKKLILTILLFALIPKAAASGVNIYTYESDDTLTAVINADNLETPVVGAAFDIYYNKGILAYQGYDEGAFFEQGGEPIYLVTDTEDHRGGKVVVGITLKRTDSMVDLSGTLIALNFQVLKENTTTLTFKNPVISTIGGNNKRQDIEIEWNDAEITFNKNIQPKVIPETTVEEIPVEEPETSHIASANILAIPLSPYVTSSLLLLCSLPLCYILWRQRKKRHANQPKETFYLSIEEPSQNRAS